jgi:hypothetical protein
MSAFAMLLLALVDVSTSEAATTCLRVDGEGLPNGASIPGWNVPIDPNAAGRTTVTAITAATNPSAVRSGNGAARVNGDFYLGKEFDVTCRGLVMVDYWHFPRPGSSTNSAVALYGTQGASETFLTISKNDQDRWFVNGAFVANYSGRYTHIVISINTNTGSFQVSLDGQQVSSQQVENANRIADGIRFITFHSGRGGAGTDSYFDDLTITGSATDGGPRLFSIVPNTGNPNSTVNVTLLGQDFVNPVTVSCSAGGGGCQALDVRLVDSRTITAVFAVSLGAVPGERRVTVSNPDGRTTPDVVNFTITTPPGLPPPFSPPTAFWENFVSASRVGTGRKAAYAHLTVRTDTQWRFLRVTLSPAAGTRLVKLVPAEPSSQDLGRSVLLTVAVEGLTHTLSFGWATLVEVTVDGLNFWFARNEARSLEFAFDNAPAGSSVHFIVELTSRDGSERSSWGIPVQVMATNASDLNSTPSISTGTLNLETLEHK